MSYLPDSVSICLGTTLISGLRCNDLVSSDFDFVGLLGPLSLSSTRNCP